MKTIRFILTLCSVVFLFSCKKFIDIPPPVTQLVSQNVFTSDASATAAMIGAYSTMMSGSEFASGGIWSVTQLAGMSADEFVNFSADPNSESFYRNNLTPDNTIIYNHIWNACYKIIYSCNAVLNGLGSSTGVSDSVKKALAGEAKFVRAFCNFYLVNLFGDIPLINSTDYKFNSISSRTPVSMVYSQIVSDLKDAETNLKDDYSTSDGERVRPNKWAATALLGRVYLFMKDWENARLEATAVIEHSGFYSLESDLNNVFLKNSSEAIWQLMPVQPDINTLEGQTFILTTAPQNVAISDYLLDAFEIGDNRRQNWIDSITVSGQTYHFAFKYKVQISSSLTEYSMVLRLAEQYLIRSEAETELNNLIDAANDLNAIRERAGLPVTTAMDQSSLRQAILHERQIELFSEWGHRWLDLKRENLTDQVLGPIKSPSWQSTQALYPIPKMEITNDPNLSQNPGY